MFFHGSANPLSNGLKLVPQTDGYVKFADNELEQFFELHRPENKISRSKAVFLSDDIDLIDCLGGYTDYIYSVLIDSTPSKHDLHWYTLAYAYLQEGLTEKATECAFNYWHSIEAESQLSCCEYLTTHAFINYEV